MYMASLFIDAMKQEGAEKEVSLLYFTYDPDVAGYRIGVRIKKASPAIPAGAVIALAAAAALIVSSYLLALPLGLELFLLEGLSPEYSPDSLLSRVMPWIPLPVSLSLVFSSLTGVYTLCFLAAWMWGDPFHRAVVGVPFRPLGLALRSSLIAIPIAASMTIVAVDAIHLFQESYGTPTGVPPVPTDPLLALLGLATAPLIEEAVFRVVPIGAFLIVYLSMLGARGEAMRTWSGRLRVWSLALLRPNRAKELLGLRTVDRWGIRGVSADEWTVVLLTSAFFGLAHCLGSMWGAGKITSAFLQGLVMGRPICSTGSKPPYSCTGSSATMGTPTA
ncbi:TPA: CPBP family intramembrane metalloprotease [Candidatus Bathyarchaeota archaeon]|nr:CPBP family intramembrane metalloprotease [Candidatus Bathyarchaeota archaeon]